MRSQMIMLAMAAVFSAGLAAAADDADKERARELFMEGVAHFEAGRHEQALTAFEEAYRLRPNWKLHYNIGQCHAVLKSYGLAIESFEAYLAEGGDDIVAERRDEVLDEVRRLRDMVGNINVTGPAGLTVFVDGAERGKTPLLTPIRITAGKKHQLSVRSGDQEVLSREVVVGSAQTATVEAPAAGETAPPAEPAEQPAEPTEQPAEQPVEDDSDGLSPVPFWIGLGATVAFGAGTIAMNFAARGKIEEIEDDPANQDLKDTGKTYQAVGITFLALTGAAAITTGILAAFTDFGGDDEEPSDVAFAPAPWASENGGGLGLQGTF